MVRRMKEKYCLDALVDLKTRDGGTRVPPS